jgi:putative transposase
MLCEFGITAFNGRSRVSDDNAFIESLFNTSKYTPRYPTGGFKNIDVCRQWATKLVQYYNIQHRHKGISWAAPVERHQNLDAEIL